MVKPVELIVLTLGDCVRACVRREGETFPRLERMSHLNLRRTYLGRGIYRDFEVHHPDDGLVAKITDEEVLSVPHGNILVVPVGYRVPKPETVPVENDWDNHDDDCSCYYCY